MRRILAMLVAVTALVAPAQAQTIVSGPIAFGSGLSVSNGGTVSIGSGAVSNAMLANSGLTLGATALTLGGTTSSVSTLTCAGCTLSGTTALPGSGEINSSGYLGIGVAPSSYLLDVANTTPARFQGGVEGNGGNAAAGTIGEYVSSNISTGSSVGLHAGGAPVNITSISLSAGDWDVRATCAFGEAATTTTTTQECAINTVSATLPTLSDTAGIALNEQTQPAGILNYYPVAATRISVSTTTTIYLVAAAVYATSTENAYGWISARRVH